MFTHRRRARKWGVRGGRCDQEKKKKKHAARRDREQEREVDGGAPQNREMTQTKGHCSPVRSDMKNARPHIFRQTNKNGSRPDEPACGHQRLEYRRQCTGLRGETFADSCESCRGLRLILEDECEDEDEDEDAFFGFVHRQQEALAATFFTLTV